MSARCWLRAALAHRDRWAADMLGRALAARGVEMIAVSDNGAEALGVVVSEQPDLLVTGDVLVILPAAELLSEAALFAPSTLRAVQVSHSDRVGPMLDAGADSVFTRQVSSQGTVDGLVAQLDPGCDPPQQMPAQSWSHMVRAGKKGEVREL